MKIVVFGYHEVGYVCLKHLVESGEDVVAVFTHEDDPRERIWFRSVPELARSKGLPTYTPSKVNEPETLTLLQRLAPDLIFSFYYRNMICQEILDLPAKGAFNLHGSYLPKYRGRAPVNWVLVNGETETGVSLHHMVKKPDAGDIVSQIKVPITLEDTALTLFHKMTDAAERLFISTFPLLKSGQAPRIPQDQSQATYFSGRKPEDGRIDWNRSALEIYNLIRAVTHPYPGAFTQDDDERVFIWSAWPMEQEFDAQPGEILLEDSKGPIVQCGKGSLLIKSAQLSSSEEADGSELLSQLRHRGKFA